MYEWETEPDYFEWYIDKLHCLILRNPEIKILNGYVGIMENHPLFNQDYRNSDVSSLIVHGGITFSGNDLTGMRADRWYLGFDTGHCFDLMPSFYEFLKAEGYKLDGLENIGVYRNFKYVRDEVIKLAEQLTDKHNYNIPVNTH